MNIGQPRRTEIIIPETEPLYAPPVREPNPELPPLIVPAPERKPERVPT